MVWIPGYLTVVTYCCRYSVTALSSPSHTDNPPFLKYVSHLASDVPPTTLAISLISFLIPVHLPIFFQFCSKSPFNTITTTTSFSHPEMVLQTQNRENPQGQACLVHVPTALPLRKWCPNLSNRFLHSILYSPICMVLAFTEDTISCQ